MNEENTDNGSPKEINISEASLVNENESQEENLEQEIQNQIQEEYNRDLTDQKTVNVDEAMKSSVDEKVVIDFLNEDYSTKYTKSKSKESTAKPDDSNFKSQFNGKSAEDLKNEIHNAETNSKKEFTAKEFEEIAKFIIFLIDSVFSTGMKMWAKDTSDTAYSLPKGKQDMLVYQLTLILVKYQAKFSIEFMFIATIVVLYAPGVMKAWNHRKESKNQKPVHQPIVETKEYYKATPYKTEAKKEESNTIKIVNEREIIPEPEKEIAENIEQHKEEEQEILIEKKKPRRNKRPPSGRRRGGQRKL